MREVITKNQNISQSETCMSDCSDVSTISESDDSYESDHEINSQFKNVNISISEEQYEIFKADAYGNSAISNLIHDESYHELFSLLEEKELSKILNLQNGNQRAQMLKSLILLTCTDAFKIYPDHKNNAKFLYNCASHQLFINGDLDSEVFLAGSEILEMNYS